MSTLAIFVSIVFVVGFGNDVLIELPPPQNFQNMAEIESVLEGSQNYERFILNSNSGKSMAMTHVAMMDGTDKFMAVLFFYPMR